MWRSLEKKIEKNKCFKKRTKYKPGKEHDSKFNLGA